MSVLPMVDALEFANYPKEFLWTEPNKQIQIRFPNGEIAECWWREALFSIYAWKLHRTYPDQLQYDLGPKYLIKFPVQKGSLLGLWNEVLHDTTEVREELGLGEQEIAQMIALEINKLHNDCCRYLTPYITSSTAKELREIIHHPEMEEIYAQWLDACEKLRLGEIQVQDAHHALEKAYASASYHLHNNPDFSHNGYARAFKAKIIDHKQFLQVVVSRGFVVDIDNYQFPEPVISSFGRGIHHIGDLAKVSRDASIAEIQSHEPVQKSDYLNRRLQLLASIIQKIIPGDCGTPERLPWKISDKDDLKSAVGQYFIDEETGEERPIRTKDKHLIGKVIQIRSASLCHHLHQYGVCEKCLGRISRSIPAPFRIGHLSVIGALSAFVQLFLSAKHLITSRQSTEFELDAMTASYMRFPNKTDHNQLMMISKYVGSKEHHVELSFLVDELKLITDIENGLSAPDIQITTASSITEATVNLTLRNGETRIDTLKLSDLGRRTHLTKDFIMYIIDNPSMVTIHRKRVYIDLALWDKTKPVIMIPHKVTGVMDFMVSFEKTIIYGARNMNIDAQTPTGISDMMRMCYNIVRQCVDIPVSHLGVMIASLLIRNKQALDYRLPLPGGKREFSTLPQISVSRSYSQAMAFEKRLEYYQNPANLLPTIAPNYVMDAIYYPNVYDRFTDIRRAIVDLPHTARYFPDVR